MSLGNILSELRKKTKMTQSELGEILHVSAQAVSKWENDISEPDIPTLRRIAEIYGVSLSSILDAGAPEESAKEAYNSAVAVEVAHEAEAASSVWCDVYLTDVGESKIKTIKYMMDMLGLTLAEAKAASENLPYLITGNEEPETAEKIVEYFADCGATVRVMSATGFNPHRKLLILTPIPVSTTENTNGMKKRFIVANVTAAIPAILTIVGLMLLFSSNIWAILENIYIGISIYAVIFLSWYPTITRKLLKPVRRLADYEGIFGLIKKMIVGILLLPWLAIVILISPILYAFEIKTRVVRMLEDDYDDDIFFDIYED